MRRAPGGTTSTSRKLNPSAISTHHARRKRRRRQRDEDSSHRHCVQLLPRTIVVLLVPGTRFYVVPRCWLWKEGPPALSGDLLPTFFFFRAGTAEGDDVALLTLVTEYAIVTGFVRSQRTSLHFCFVPSKLYLQTTILQIYQALFLRSSTGPRVVVTGSNLGSLITPSCCSAIIAKFCTRTMTKWYMNAIVIMIDDLFVIWDGVHIDVVKS